MPGAPAVNPQLRDKYEAAYSGPSAWREAGARAKADNLLAIAGHLTPDSVLEVGAGEGAVLGELSRRGFGRHLHALEISDSGVAAIRGRGLARLESVQRFDGYSLPFADRSVDLVYATHVLEHVEHERAFLYELARVGRRCFIEVPLQDLVRLRDDFLSNQEGHINCYNWKTVRLLLESSGLRVLDQRLFDYPLAVTAFQARVSGVAKFLLRRGAFLLARPLARNVFTYHCAMLCEPA